MAKMAAARWDVPVMQSFASTRREANHRLAALVDFAYEECVKRSPVLKGEFRGNWRVAIDGPDVSTDEDYRSSNPHGSLPSGGERSTSGIDKVVQRIASTGRFQKVPDEIFVTNSLPYAIRLEYGYSKQAPHGIVRIVQQIIDRITKQA